MCVHVSVCVHVHTGPTSLCSQLGVSKSCEVAHFSHGCIIQDFALTATYREKVIGWNEEDGMQGKEPQSLTDRGRKREADPGRTKKQNKSSRTVKMPTPAPG